MGDMTVLTETSTEISTDELGEQICTLAGHMTAALCRWLVLVAEFDRREGWAVDGIVSCAHWLSWRCGIALGTARDQVRVARKLTDLPLITARFAAGELSYAKVRALVRIATPRSEEALVELALEATASQLEDMVAEFKASEAAALGNARRRRAARYLRHRYHRDGSIRITVRLPPEEGAMVLDLLEDITRADGDTTQGQEHEHEPEPVPVSAETPTAVSEPNTQEPDNAIEPSPGEQARADALIAMAHRAATTLGEDTIAAADRAHLLISLDAATVFGDETGACHLTHGPALAFETACRLGCEGTMAVLIRDSTGNPLHLGDTTPTVTRRQKRALMARDKECRFPGCGARRYLHAHHIIHWIKGGKTCISNLMLLCGRHHRLVHEGGFTVTGRDGHVAFARPDADHTPIPAHPPTTGDPTAIVDDNTRAGLTIDADTTGSRSNGERYDRGFASDVLWCLLHPEYILGTRPAPRGTAA